MKSILYFTILLLFVPFGLCAQENDTLVDKETDILIGEWTIDLRPTPKSDPYFQSFIVELTKENKFQGTFYGSKVENSFLNTNWDKLYFAFTTKDQSNEYYHSGYMQNGKLFGITYCPNRELTAPWTGEKK